MEGNLLITLLPTIAEALPTLSTIAVALPTLIALVAADVRFCQPGGDLRGGKRSQDQSKEERVHCWFDQSSNDPFASLSMSFCFLETRCRGNISPTSLCWLPTGRLVCLVTCFLGLPADQTLCDELNVVFRTPTGRACLLSLESRDWLEILRRRSYCWVASSLPDTRSGSPQEGRGCLAS